MKLRTSEYFIQETLRSLRRNNWMSFASVGTVAVSLFVLGVFLLLVLNMNRMASALESQVQISVYLEDGLSADDRQDIASDIEALQGIESIRYISKDEAKARLEDRLGDQKYLLDALGDKNPLPDSFEVVVKSPDLVETAAMQQKLLMSGADPVDALSRRLHTRAAQIQSENINTKEKCDG